MKRVLVVEDEASIREMVALNLKMAGWEVVEAPSAERALELMHSGEHCDAALLDIMLPGMDGLSLCETIRRGKWAFVQLGSAYAAVYCSNGMRMQDFGSNKDRECIAEGRRCIWLVRAAQADEFAAFEDFKAAMRGAALDADAEGRRYRFVDPVYGELRCQWGETLYVNDTPMQYSGFDNYGKLTMQEK